MLTVAVWVLSIAVAAGTILALWHLRATDAASRPPLAAGVAHGVVGTAGLLALLLTLGGPPRAVYAGAGSFGTMAAVLLAGAVLSGLGVLLLRQKAMMITVHAGLAVIGYVLFLAWDSLG